MTAEIHPLHRDTDQAVSEITTQDQLLCVLATLRHTGDVLKRADPALLDSVMLSTPQTGPRKVAELLDAVTFDFQIAKIRLAKFQAAKSTLIPTEM